MFTFRRTTAAVWSLLFLLAFAANAQVEVAAEDASDNGERKTIVEQIQSDSMRATLEMIERYVDSEPAALAPQTAPPGATRRLSVRECVELAVSQNPKVFVADADVDAATARIGQARSRHLPQVSAGVALTWNDRFDYDENGYSPFNISGSTGGIGGGIGGGGLGGGFGGGFGGGGLGFGGDIATSFLIYIASQNLIQDFIKDSLPEKDTFTETVKITQTLYAGGQISAAIRAAAAMAESEEWRREATLQEIEYQAKQSFFDVLLAEALVRVGEESVLTFQRNLADAQEMYEVGMISSFEVLRAQTELGNREAELVQARNGLRLAETNLRRILALPQDTMIELEPSLDWLPNPLPLSYYVDEAKKTRPEIRSIEEAIEAARQDIRRVKGTYKPQVGATAEFQNTHDAGEAVADGWLVNIGAQWEIAAGGRRKFERKEAEAQLRSLENQLNDLYHLVELDVTQSIITIQDAMAEIKRNRGTVELAREGLSIAELRFQQGVGTQAETLDAELALTNAETGLVRAVRNYAVGNAALERATGKSWLRSDAETDAAKPAGK